MDANRKGQIALLIIKRKLQEEGVRLKPSFRRELGEKAKAIGISLEEAMEFYEAIVRELMDETFAKSPASAK